MNFRGYTSRRAWARAKMRTMRRFPGQLRRAVLTWWWRSIGERERVAEERDRYKAWGKQQFERAAKAEHAVHMLKAEHRGASVDLLRMIADQIDCGPGCEQVGSMDMTTGVTECHLSDRGECPFDHACELRDLASALETVADRDSGSRSESRDASSAARAAGRQSGREAASPDPYPPTGI